MGGAKGKWHRSERNRVLETLMELVSCFVSNRPQLHRAFVYLANITGYSVTRLNLIAPNESFRTNRHTRFGGIR